MKKKILIGVSGSVATIKLPEILNQLTKEDNYSIKVIVTKNSSFFLDLSGLKKQY